MLASHRMIKGGHSTAVVVAAMASSFAIAASVAFCGRGLIPAWPSLVQGPTSDLVQAPGRVQALASGPVVPSHPSSPVVRRTKPQPRTSDPGQADSQSRSLAAGAASPRGQSPASPVAKPDLPTSTPPTPAPTPSPLPTPDPVATTPVPDPTTPVTVPDPVPDPGDTSGAGGTTVCVDTGIIDVTLGSAGCTTDTGANPGN